jgi:hypothetical protein
MSEQVWAFVAGAVAGGGAFAYLGYHIGFHAGHQEAVRVVAEGE